MELNQLIKQNYPELNGIYDTSKLLMSCADNAAHDFSHVLRVTKLAIRIYNAEKIGDPSVIIASSLLHDVKRKTEDNQRNKMDHAEAGSIFARNYLHKLGFHEDYIDKVSSSIFTHSYSKKRKPEYIEGRILQDADRLDALGAIAIARVFNHNNGLNRKLYDPFLKPKKEYDGVSVSYLNHFFEKILKIEPDSFWSEEAKIIARKRYDYTREFVCRFLREWYSLE
ncbi:MAG: HD domain-containing protein [Kosmotoga sp.]|nr:MAG: HD domain-containing protein [Kosmotoga sp.]